MVHIEIALVDSSPYRSHMGDNDPNRVAIERNPGHMDYRRSRQYHSHRYPVDREDRQSPREPMTQYHSHMQYMRSVRVVVDSTHPYTTDR